MGRNPNGSKKNKGKSKKGTKNKGKSKKGSLLDMVHQKWDLDDANNRLPERRRAAQEALGRASYAGDAAAAHKAVVEDGADVNAAVYNTYDGTMGGNGRRCSWRPSMATAASLTCCCPHPSAPTPPRPQTSQGPRDRAT